MMLLIGRRKNKGFLLLEAMVSIAILSIGLVLILSSFIRSIRAIELSKDYFRAGLLFGEKMYEIYNSRIEEGSSGGIFADFNNAFSWHLDVLTLDGPLSEVNLEVSWNRKDRKHDISLATYLKP